MQQSRIHENLDRATNDILFALENRISILSQDIVRNTDTVTRRQDRSDTLLVETANHLTTSIDLACKQSSKLGDDEWAQVKEVADMIIVNSLVYPSMNKREDVVAEAHAKTFEWIFQDTISQPSNSFKAWLENGHGLYWINGKAASGKSTLMKFLCNNSQVETALEGWSDGVPVLIAKYFFFNLGTHMQKCQAGLLLSLLHQVLHQAVSQRRDLIPVVFPDDWQVATQQVVKRFTVLDRISQPSDNSEEYIFAKKSDVWLKISSEFEQHISWRSWSLSKLKNAFHNLIEQTVIPFKLCCFIDGLDEFDGDHYEIATYFKTLSISKNAKFCLSSRPLMPFEQEFGSCPQLTLQDLTLNDISIYVRDKFNTHTRALELAREEPELVSQLIAEIVSTSSGVFLWISLVVKSLLTGMTNFDRISDLQKRLRELPPELDDLYSHMITNIQPSFYLEQASRLFQIIYSSYGCMSTLAFAFADDEDPKITSTAVLEHSARVKRVRVISGRLKSRCAGLLEVLWGFPDFYIGQGGHCSQVRYLHLTVKEFLEKPKVWTELTKKTAGTGFDANVSNLKAIIVQLRPDNPQYAEFTSSVALSVNLDFLVQGALSHALQAENSTGVAQTLLLDELEKAVLEICASSGRRHFHNGPCQVPWSTQGNDFGYHGSFLNYAVSKGLTRYVQVKLGQQAISINKASSRPLLEYATTYTLEPSRVISAQPAMVAMLLEAGMDPNEERRNGSPWSKILIRLSKAVEKRDELDSAWLDTCKLFAMHGAACDEHKLWEATKVYSSVFELMKQAFSHLSQDSVQELRGMLYPRKSQCAKTGDAKKRARPGM